MRSEEKITKEVVLIRYYNVLPESVKFGDF